MLKKLFKVVSIIEIQKLGIDTFKFEAISDAFGAKMISERGFSPQASLDIEISGLIQQRNANLKTLGVFQIFSERLKNIQNGVTEPAPTKPISVKDYFDMCIKCWEQILSLTNSNETEYIAYLNKQLEAIEIRRDASEKMSNSDRPLTKDELEGYITEGTNFDALCNMYEQRIPCRLNLIGLEKGINNICIAI